jgi:hypothetical protein
MVAVKLMTSAPYAHASPTDATMTPPIAGPTIRHVFHITWFSASALDRSSPGTRFGVRAERVDSPKPAKPAISAAPR